MTRRSRTAASWFNLGARAFAKAFPTILPEHDDTFYVCPLCMYAFTRQAIAAGSVTLEDVPPKSVGGKPLVLTCRRCNSRSGHELDAHVRRAEDLVAGITGTLGRPQRVRIVMGDVKLNALLETSADPRRRMLITGLPNNNAPKVRQAFEDHLERATGPGRRWDGLTVEFYGEAYSPSRADIGWLRAAFLLAFALFGYRYALNPALASVRRQIATPTEKVIERFKIALPPPFPSRRAFIRIQEPEWLDALAVQFGRHVVFLPHTNDKDFYERLDRGARDCGSETVHFQGTEMPWPTGPAHRLDLR